MYTLKASRLITHRHRLKGEALRAAQMFCGKAALLDKCLGCVLFQLPPSFRKDLSLLEEFLSGLRRDIRHVVEFRHNSWICDETFLLLESRRVGYCIVSAPNIDFVVRATAPHAYFRFHGSKRWFDYQYTEEEMRTWANRVAALLKEGREVFAYFNNDVNAYAVKNAEQLNAFVGRQMGLKTTKQRPSSGPASD